MHSKNCVLVIQSDIGEVTYRKCLCFFTWTVVQFFFFFSTRILDSYPAPSRLCLFHCHSSSTPSSFIHKYFFIIFTSLMPHCVLIIHHCLKAFTCLSPSWPHGFASPGPGLSDILIVLTYCSQPSSRCAAHWEGIVGILTWTTLFKQDSPAAARRAALP